MKKLFFSLKKQAMAALMLLFLLSACYEFEFVNQSGSADHNSSFIVDISIITTDGGGAWHTPYFGIKLPEGWTISDSINFIYDEGQGIFAHSDSASLEMELIEEAEPGYYWWVAQGTESVLYDYEQTYTFSPEIHTDDQSGNFLLDYMVGSSSGYYGGGLNWRRENDNLITVGLEEEIVVTSNNNDGPGSLREAIENLDFYGTISFNLNTGNTISLDEELWINKDLNIGGPENDPVILSGGNQTRVMFIAPNTEPSLTHLTVAYGTAEYGGGMYCAESSTPLLEDVSFMFNAADQQGGAIYTYQSSPVLTNVHIHHNNANQGGGFYCGNSSYPQFSASIIRENAAESHGGGLYFASNSLPFFDSINRNSIFLNSALYGTDMSSESILDVVLDTFTVIIPTEMHASPIGNFTFDILNGKIEQSNSDLYVSPDGDNNNTGLTPDDPLKTINVALLKMIAGPADPHTIHLLEGVYAPSTNGETFPIVMRDHINLSGSSTTEVILDAEDQSHLIIFQNIMFCKIENMTLTNGLNNAGGAIHCYTSNPVLENLILTGNKATQNGGGLYLYSSNPILNHVNIIENTSSGFGGGIYCQYSSPDFSETNLCNIYLNLASSANDIYSNQYITMHVDTFTVITPNEYQAYPLNNFEFNIQHGKVSYISSDIYVSPDGNNLNSGLNASTPLKNINFAASIILPDSGEVLTMNLLEGNYSPSQNGETFPIKMQHNVNISGISMEEVILDAEQTETVIFFYNDGESILSNLSITGGQNSNSDGGGISIQNCDPVLENLLIYGNSVSYGGGIYLYQANPEITNCKIYENTASGSGGGLYCNNSNPIITGVSFSNNIGNYGGGIYTDNSSPELNAVSIFNNSAYSGGGILCGYQSVPVMKKVSIHNNTATTGGGLYVENYSSPLFDEFERCNIYFNEAQTGSDLYTYNNINITVDTFTVLYPKYQHAYPLSNFTFDIWNGMIQQVEADLYVSPEGDDSNSGVVADEPLKTISHALVKIVEDSLNLYTIHLLDGIYSPSTNGETFPLHLSEYVNLSGTSNESVILDAEQTSYLLHIQDIVEVSISDLTIQGGQNNYGGGVYCVNSSPSFENIVITNNVSIYHGGGFYCSNNASPSIKNSIISENTAWYDGGGIYLADQSNTQFENVIIKNNSAISGAGIYLYYSSAELQEVSLIGNQASSNGGGYYGGYTSSSTLKDVNISNNTAIQGGGIFTESSSDLFFDPEERCNIYFNDATKGKEIYAGDYIEVVVDTFSVLFPTEYFVFPLENFNFDILNGLIEQVDEDLFVSPTGDDSNSGLVAEDPLKTLNAAFMKIMADSIHQHTVFLLEGIYGPSSNGEVFPLNIMDYVSISGVSPYTAILDGEDTSGILIFEDNIGSEVSNLILRNGKSQYGGAIHCFNSSPNLSNLVITNNVADEWGGGIYCEYHSSPTLDNISFSKNSAYGGAGLACSSMSNPIITNSTFKNNNATGQGGGLYCRDNSDPEISNVVFTVNTAQSGGAVCLDYDSDPSFEHTSISSNHASNGGGIYCSDNSTPVLTNTDIAHNKADEKGGGIYSNYASPLFDTSNRCNIYLNEAVSGMDLYSLQFMEVVVDTFTVLYPTKFFAEPLGNFEFDILHGLIDQVDADLYVSPTGDDDNTGLTADSPLKTIHNALSKIVSNSTNPHTIHLLDGTFSPSLNGEFLPINVLDYITLSGSSAELVILDGENQSGVMEIVNTEGVVISNLTITGGYANYGGGIYIADNSNPILSNLVIKNNTAQYWGGGIYCISNENVLMDNLSLENNDAETGGGISIYNNEGPTLQNLTIINNLAESLGGGIYIYNNSSPTISSTVLGNNHSMYAGGGMAIEYSQFLSIADVILESNSAINYGGGVFCSNSTSIFEDVLFEGNSAIYGGGYYGQSNGEAHFAGVTIKNNSAQNMGGGAYTTYNSEIVYDIQNRSSIYFNYATNGNDLYSDFSFTNVVLDTFTVMIPKGHHAYPLPNFSFDILHGLLPQEQVELYVSPDGDNSNSGLSAEDPFKNIQYAITGVVDDSLNFYNIHLMEGTFSPSSNNETFPLQLEDFVVLSGSSAEETILDAEETSGVIGINNRMNTSISNLLITGGNTNYGGGIYINNSNPVLENLKISENYSANSGGGIYCDYSSPYIYNSDISSNTSSGYGGGIYCINNSVLEMENITVNNNTSSSGGGIYNTQSEVTLKQVTLSENSSFNYGGGIVSGYSSWISLENSILKGNTAGLMGGGIYTEGNNSYTMLSGTSIIFNSAVEEGGGVYNYSEIEFDSVNRSNIYMNNSNSALDIYSSEMMHVIVDTFTVLYPKNQHAYPLSNFTFDILHGVIPQVQADLFVSPTGDDNNGGLTADDPLKTINYALSIVAEDSVNLYTINLMEGTYSPGTNGESFPIHMVNYVNLSGISPEDVILNAQGLSQVVRFDNIVSAKISGLTISGGYGEYNEGGGIHCYYSSPDIENVSLINNESFTGGAIYCGHFSNPEITNVTVNGNQANLGGGIYIYYHSSPEISNSNIINNYGNSGGGVYCYEHSNPVFENVEIISNSALEGAGMYCSDDSYPSLFNTKFSNNSATISGGGIYCNYNSMITLSMVHISNNTSNVEGGGIWCNSNSEFIFDTTNRSTIYLNYSATGNDLYSDNFMTVVVDTFTVMFPKNFHSFPRYNFDFDILYGLIPQVNADLYVSPEGDNTNSGLTPDEALRTIHFATSVIAEDSLNLYDIKLSSGIYSPSTNGEYFPIYIPEYVGLEGADMNTTILDAEQTATVMEFSFSHDMEIKNLTITGGYNEFGYGGGIHMEHSSPVLTNITVINNYAKYGGGIMLEESNPSFHKLTVQDNSTLYSGGGICCFENSNPTIDSAIIWNNETSTYGGGVYCSANSSPTLKDVSIQYNQASTGGGMYCGNNSDPNLDRVQIIGNTAEHSGGGIYAPYSNITIRNTVVSDNTSTSKGGGIYLSNFTNIIENTLIANNVAKDGGGLYVSSSDPIMINLSVTGNEATNFGGAIYFSVCDAIVENLTAGDNLAAFGSGIYSYRSTTDLKNSILWNQSTDEVYFKETGDSSKISVSHSLIQGAQAGIVTNGNGSIEWLEGNLSDNPVFINSGEYPFALDVSSPCIDAGLANLDSLHLTPMDILGNHRLWDGDGDGDTLVDLGAYEYGATQYIVGMNEQFYSFISELSLKIYPNPITDLVSFDFESAKPVNIYMDIYDISGNKLLELANNKPIKGKETHTFNLSGLNKGIYFIRINTGKELITKKIIKIL